MPIYEFKCGCGKTKRVELYQVNELERAKSDAPTCPFCSERLSLHFSLAKVMPHYGSYAPKHEGLYARDQVHETSHRIREEEGL